MNNKMKNVTQAPGWISTTALIIGIAFFCGCASMEETRVFDYSSSLGLKVIKADPIRVNKECQAKYLDNGSLATNSNRFLGCWKPDTREIWIDWNHPDVLIHELCHVSGKLESDCGIVQWE